MALGFTSHYNTNQGQPFGTLVISSNENESETAGSVAYNNSIINGLLYNCSYDSLEFSTSVEIDYSQYASYVASTSSGSTETAGSIAYSGGSFAGATTFSSAGVSSFSGGGASCCSCSSTFTC